jgi:hypothetical protein
MAIENSTDTSGGLQGGTNPREDSFGQVDSGGDRNSPSRRKGSGFRLPPGFENILLADGRTLGDLFGNFGRFRDRQSGEVWARLMERRAQASRLGFTKSQLTRQDGDANVRRPTLLEG